MSEEQRPSQVPSADPNFNPQTSSQGAANAPPPTAVAGKAAGKPHPGLIVGGIVVLVMLWSYFSGSKGTPSGGAAAAASAQTSNGAASSNPLIGSWTLVDTDKSFCTSHEIFTPTTNTTVKNGATSSGPVTYNVHPNLKTVDVNTGNVAQYSQYDMTGPDEITFRISSLYVVASCKYRRD